VDADRPLCTTLVADGPHLTDLTVDGHHTGPGDVETFLQALAACCTIIRETNVAVLSGNDSMDAWHVGVTNDPDERKQALLTAGYDMTRWRQWSAETVLDARAIKHLFLTLGMQRNGDDDAPSSRLTYTSSNWRRDRPRAEGYGWSPSTAYPSKGPSCRSDFQAN